jgi:anaerobic ribonucleoside-triphosphate reductase activating protein
MTIKKTQSLGPYTRYAIWTQGCYRQCPGCISRDSWSLDGGYEEDTEKLANDIINTDAIEGITVSGGEPFLQSDALVDLIKRIRMKKDVGVIIYTGFTIDELKENELISLCDIVIGGEYEERLNDNMSLRGSSNQSICMITSRYINEVKNLYGIKGRRVEIHFQEGRATLIGIPDKASLGFLSGEKYDG